MSMVELFRTILLYISRPCPEYTEEEDYTSFIDKIYRVSQLKYSAEFNDNIVSSSEFRKKLQYG